MKATPLTSSLLAVKGDARPAVIQRTDLTGQPVIRLPSLRIGAATAETWSAPNRPPPTSQNDGRRVSNEIAKLTLRLDRERHLRLKMFAAQRRTSMQRILVLAIDAYMAGTGHQAGATRRVSLDEVRAQMARLQRAAKAWS